MNELNNLQEWLGATLLYLKDLPWFSFTIYACSFGLALVGLIGSFLPFLPGSLLIFIAGILPYCLLNPTPISLWVMICLALLLILSYLIDTLSGFVGARWFGASGWGITGAAIGSLIGLFFFPIGIIIGPLAGGFLFEKIFAKKRTQEAAKSTAGNLIGTGIGLLLRLLISIIMAMTLLFDLLNG
jgi:uncharacterized protein